MYISSYLNLFLACTAALIASTPDVHCNAAYLRSSLAKPDQVEEDLIEGPLGMEEDDTSLWRWGGKHRYHGGRRGGYNKHHYGGYKNKHHYDDWGYPPQSPWVASAM